MKTISRNDLMSKLDRGESVTLLEALAEQYYRSGHLPGALLFPHDQAVTLAEIVAPDKHAPIVLYCSGATCTNSHRAAEALNALGYTDVSVYVEGKADWKSAGLPIER